MEQLSCKHNSMRVFERAGLPTRLHFAKNRRIEDIVLDMDPGYTASVTSDWYLMGQHGYDNYATVMNETPPPTSSFPSGDLGPLLGMSGCSGDLSAPEEWLQALDISSGEQATLEAYHSPWGIPHSGSLPADLTLLHHRDHLTGRSPVIVLQSLASEKILYIESLHVIKAS
ncbi:hypothetical protein SK128_014600 [Halocaridina rubra]|uniref:Uncharacterized protein n=1 Tax=Halocaridina rubra TaxID=373956 RepID=A0AAN9AEP9_HALRR